MDIIGEYKVVDRWNYCDRPFIIENDPEYDDVILRALNFKLGGDTLEYTDVIERSIGK